MFVTVLLCNNVNMCKCLKTQHDFLCCCYSETDSQQSMSGRPLPVFGAPTPSDHLSSDESSINMSISRLSDPEKDEVSSSNNINNNNNSYLRNRFSQEQSRASLSSMRGGSEALGMQSTPRWMVHSTTSALGRSSSTQVTTPVIIPPTPHSIRSGHVSSSSHDPSLTLSQVQPRRLLFGRTAAPVTPAVLHTQAVTSSQAVTDVRTVTEDIACPSRNLIDLFNSAELSSDSD